MGVHYNTVTWTWALPDEKLLRLLHLLKELMGRDNAAQHVIWTLVGKIQHVKPLVPAGKFNIYHLVKANAVSTDRNFSVTLTRGFKS